MRRRGYGVTAVLVLTTGCGTLPAADVGPPGSPAPGGTDRPDVVVTTGQPVTVLDDGDGPEACLGAVMTSLPPQCGGTPLVGWEWADHDGQYETQAGVRWGGFLLTGPFDGTRLTVAEAVPAASWTGTPPPPPTWDFSPPCPVPPGGWSTERMPLFAEDVVFRAAEARPDYAGGWVDERESYDPPPGEPAADAPEPQVLPPVVTIRVTGDPAAAEAELREVWDGPLCVTSAERTEAELSAVQASLSEDLGDGLLLAASDVLTGTVEATVTFDDGTLQAALDERHGEGVVRLTSALLPVG